MPIISFKNFSFRYDNLKEATLKNINLNIESGEKILIAGPSGSGKSTLAHCINGLIPFTYKGQITGSLQIKDITPYKTSIYDISKYVGTILQDQDGQFVGLTVGEDTAFAYENNMIPQKEMFKGVNKALTEVGMLDFINSTPHNLSGGQKQKVSIAGILATDTDILLFDEPLANLDPASGVKAMEIIDKIHAETHKTVIIVEHRIEDVLEHNFDRIIVINNGEVAANGSPDIILPTNTLNSFGLREPLYIELLKNINAPLSSDNKISKIDNCIKYKDIIMKNYKNNPIKNSSVEKNALLSVENISFKYFEDLPYRLKNINFSIKEGEMLAILGNNGAGKSTLLKVISGIVKHQNGTIKYKDKIIDKWSIKKRAEIMGYVMQNPNHMITKNMIYDEIAFGPRNFGVTEDEVNIRVEEALKICGLYKYRKWPVSSLSYGQKKRLTIASILSMKPKIIFLDEPTAGQDHKNYKEFMTFLEKIKKSGVSIVMITHDMHLALEYADRAMVLCDGEIIASDSVFNIMSNEDILKKANLKETSISKIAHLMNIPDVSDFLSYFVTMLKANAIKGDCNNE